MLLLNHWLAFKKDKATNFYSDPVDQHLVSVGYSVDSGTYTLKAFVTQP